MLLSELLKAFPDKDVIKLEREKPFDRFARTTSVTQCSCCVFVGSERYVSTIPDNATMIITTSKIAQMIKNEKVGLCVTKNPKATFFRCFNNAASLDDNREIRETIIGKDCQIGQFTSISKHNVVIGNNVTIEDFVTIYDNVNIGDNCVIRSGARVGVQDYNYYDDNGTLIHLEHYGSLIIEKDVEVGFNSVIGKSLYPGDVTIIGEGSKLANCCAVGHDCKLGKRVMIYAGTMLAGFVEIGDDTHITLNSTIRNGLKIGSGVTVNMGSVVIRNIPDGQVVFGNPAKKIISPR